MKQLRPLDLGIAGFGVVHRNLAVPKLVLMAIERGEGVLTETGALNVITGKYTGRSPQDKFLVDTPAVHDDIAWGDVNHPISKARYDALKAKVLAYLQGRELFVNDGFAGADPKYRQAFRIVNEYASQNLFMHQLLIRPCEEDLEDFKPDFMVYCAPGFQCIPEVDGTHSETAILLNLEEKEIIIVGNRYSGEMKKAVFSAMNYVLPKNGVLSMHCSANVGPDGDTAVFFGLSGIFQREPESCADVRVQQPQALPVHFHDPPADAQAQPGPFAGGMRPVRRKEAVEDLFPVFLRHADAVVPHGDLRLPAPHPGAQRDLSAPVRELDGVVQQIDHDLVDPVPVRPHRAWIRFRFARDLDLFLFHVRHALDDRPPQHLIDVEHGHFRRRVIPFQPAQCQEVVHQSAQPL